MGVKLYVQPGSSPSRAAWMTLKHLNVPFELKTVNALKGEHKTAAFLKINPCHTLPVLDDDGYIIWESRAIQIYLAEKYGDGRDNGLYPKEPQKRGKVLSMLNWDISVLYKVISDWMSPQVLRQSPPDAALASKMESALEAVESRLREQRYVCGDELTLADLSLLASLTYSTNVLDYRYQGNFPHIHSYIDKLAAQLPYYHDSLRGMHVWKELLTASPPKA